MSNLYSNSIFWVETEKIKPNPYQPRREFDENKLRDLADSIRQYGVLQPLVVSRIEIEKEEGGIVTEYELIAGERRLRASRLANILQVPVIIRVGDNSTMKLELAIIENLQREDLNAVDRARAFEKLVKEFEFTHAQIGQKMGKSREYVSNTLRILALPESILLALSEGKISEGHTRPLMMLSGHPEEQITLFKEIIVRKTTVREAERLARRIAYDRVRVKEYIIDPEITELEEEFSNVLGTRVHVEKKDNGGKITIDFFSVQDLQSILSMVKSKNHGPRIPTTLMENYMKQNGINVPTNVPVSQIPLPSKITLLQKEDEMGLVEPEIEQFKLVAEESESENTNEKNENEIEVEPERDVELSDDSTKEEMQQMDEDLYNIKNFSL